MTYSAENIWFIIAAMGVGTFLIRFSFIGLVGNRDIPSWVLRLLRYTPVAVLPGIAAPLVFFPEATGGQPDPARLLAATVTMAVGVTTKNVILSITSGALTLYGMMYLLG